MCVHVYVCGGGVLRRKSFKQWKSGEDKYEGSVADIAHTGPPHTSSKPRLKLLSSYPSNVCVCVFCSSLQSY